MQKLFFPERDSQHLIMWSPDHCSQNLFFLDPSRENGFIVDVLFDIMHQVPFFHVMTEFLSQYLYTGYLNSKTILSRERLTASDNVESRSL